MRRAAYRIPFWATIGEASAVPFRNFRTLARFAWPWLLALLVAEAALAWFYFPYRSADAALAAHDMAGFAVRETAAALVTMVISLILGSIVAVSWHRFLLLGEQPSAHKSHAKPISAYTLRSAVITLLVLAPLLIVGALIASMPDPGALATDLNVPAVDEATAAASAALDQVDETAAANPWMCAVCVGLAIIVGLPIIALISYVPTRFSLSLPATALGSSERSFASAWRLSRSNVWRLMWGGLLVSWPCFAVMAISMALWGGDMVETRAMYVGNAVLIAAVSFATGILWVGFLSIAYRRLTAAHSSVTN